MKIQHILFSGVAFLAVVSTYGQIKKGSVFLGGDIGGSSKTVKANGAASGKENSLRISPV